MLAPLASRVRKSGTGAPGSSVCVSTANRDRHRHQTGVRRDIEQFLPVGPPPRLAPARRRHLPRAAGPRKRSDVDLHCAWIRSTDTPPTARRARIAPPSRRRASARPGTACGRRPAAGPRGPTPSSDAGSRRAGTAHRATRPAATLCSPVTSRGCSSPAPLAAFSNRSQGPLRKDLKHHAAPIRGPQRMACRGSRRT